MCSFEECDRISWVDGEVRSRLVLVVCDRVLVLVECDRILVVWVGVRSLRDESRSRLLGL
ncbi:MAG: hypothetical protein HC785_30685 [Calothrix sp. CSU_2_0]|nr:hypothetical protein [Calothrix sp. CSU_2_0]